MIATKPMLLGVLLGGLLCGSLAGRVAAAEATAPDPCQRALHALDNEEARAVAAPRGAASVPAGLVQARRVAAAACLGPGTEHAAPPPQRVQAPISVPGVRAVPTPTPSAARTAPAAAPAPQPRLPQVLMSCDAAGCWTSDGTRLQRAGPVLNGPRGACSVAGNAVACP